MRNLPPAGVAAKSSTYSKTDLARSQRKGVATQSEHALINQGQAASSAALIPASPEDFWRAVERWHRTNRPQA
jgi:hypothetical protein